MKNEKLSQVLEEIDDRFIQEAAAPRPSRRPLWFGAIAASLALCILLGLLFAGSSPQGSSTTPSMEADATTTAGTTSSGTASVFPTQPSAPSYGAIDLSAVLELPDLVAAPTLPEMMQVPVVEDFENWNDYYDAMNQWRISQREFYSQPQGYADSLDSFFRQSIGQFLSGDKNCAYSPVNVYLAMAMLAETANGSSRQQILDLFGVDSIEALRTQADHLWNAHYCNDGETTLLLSNSLWLTNRYSFCQDTVDLLSERYSASVFRGDLGTDASNEQLQAWLNAMTGGLLQEQANNTKLSPDAVFALASTIYFKAGWVNEFSETRTADGTFHSPNGDLTVSFLHGSQQGSYYRGSNFGAVELPLTGSNSMWIILPDEGVTVSQVLASQEYLDMTADPSAFWVGEYLLNISLPKFDVSSQSDLIEGMKSLGLTDLFDFSTADFTALVPGSESQLKVGQIDHAARVTIDEKGIIAAAYTVIEVEDEACPSPSQELDFTADRPFLFIVSSRDNLPLFAGVVTEP